MDGKQISSKVTRRNLFRIQKAGHVLPVEKLPVSLRSYLQVPSPKPPANPRPRASSWNKYTHTPTTKRLTLQYPAPRDISLIYTYHKPSRDKPRRSSSLRPSTSMSRSETENVSRNRKSRPESLSSSAELEPSLSPADTPHRDLCRDPSRSSFAPTLGHEPNLTFVKQVFPEYDFTTLNTLLPPEPQPEELRFIQEVQASMEHSDSEDLNDSFSKGIGCTEDEFRARITFSDMTQASSEKDRKPKDRISRMPYKELSLVGLLPLEEVVHQVPLVRDRRDRPKTYTGAGGFTVSAKRMNLLPEIEYSYYTPSPIRPQTQLSALKRSKPILIEARIPRPQSSNSGAQY